MTFNYRCSKRRTCGARRTLTKRLRFYVRRPKCPGCGQDTLKLDPWTGAATQRRTCYCDGIFWPHRKGTFLNQREFCQHADVEEIGGEVVYRVKMRPNEVCPF